MYEVSSKMAADIFTKSFAGKVKWLEVCRLVNIVDKDVFYDLIAHSHAPSVAQTAGGGTARDQPATPAPHPATSGQTIESLPPSGCKPMGIMPNECKPAEVQMAVSSSPSAGESIFATLSNFNVPRSGKSDASRRETSHTPSALS